MRIVIDLQADQSASRVRGIGRYSINLAKGIIRQAKEHEILLALSDRFPDTIPNIRREFANLVPRENIVTFSIPSRISEENPLNSWRTQCAELIRENFFERLNPDILHLSSLFEGFNEDVASSINRLQNNYLTTMTLYDLIPYIHQETYLPTKNAKDYYLRKIKSLLNSNGLLTISEYSKKEVLACFPNIDLPIMNISSAVDEKFKPSVYTCDEINKIFAKYQIFKPFILYSPGGFDRRKNFDGLLIAYSNLSTIIRNEYQLVITGMVSDETSKEILSKAKKIGISECDLVFTNYISDDDLIALYNNCALFVFPSFYEGFGLPILEAISCGAVVIASNTSSIPEIINCREALFDPTQPKEISTLIEQVLNNEIFRNNLLDNERAQIKNFSWDISAKKTIAFFEEIHQPKSPAKINNCCSPNSCHNNLYKAISNLNTSVQPTESDLIDVAECIAINNPIIEHNQLLVDISVLVKTDAKSGIQRVVRSVLKQLITNPPVNLTVRPIYFDGQYFRYANKFVNLFLNSAKTDFFDEIIDFSSGDIYLGLDLTAHLITQTSIFLKRFNTFGVKTFFIIYDILLIQHPEWWPVGTSGVFHQWLQSICEIATGLICISKSVALEVKEWIANNSTNHPEPLFIGYFHLGADIQNSVPTIGIPENGESVITYLQTNPSFLMVGTIEPRKGHAQTIEAFELLWEQGISANLVIVGKKGWLVENVVNKMQNHVMLNKHLFWLDGISDEYLEKVYSSCICLLAPSEAEGFGLPLIEAAQKKKPIIARDIPVFREIAGNNATYFSGNEPEIIAKTIIKWLELEKLKKNPQSSEICSLSWEESTNLIINLITDESNENWIEKKGYSSGQSL